WHLLVLLLDFLFLLGITKLKISTLGYGPTWESVLTGTLNWIWFLLIYLFYFYLIFRILKQYKEKVLHNFSELHNLGVKWVNQIVYGFLGLVLIDILVGLFSFNFPEIYTPYHGLINTITYT